MKNQKSKIKNYILACIICLITCASSFGNVAVVSGTWERNMKVNQIRLYQMIDGALTEIASSTLNADNMFFFAVNPQPEGFYFIGVNPQPANRYTIYLKSGDRLDLTITEDSYLLNGDNSKENVELKKCHEFMTPVEQQAVYFLKANLPSFRDYFSVLEQKATEFAKMPPSRTGNRTFDRKFDAYKKIDFPFQAVASLFIPRSAHPTANEYPKYFHDLNHVDFVQTTELLDYPNSLQMIERIPFIKVMITGAPSINPVQMILENMETYIPNDTVKGEMTLKFATSRRTFAGLLDYQELYGKYFITEKQKNQFLDILNALNEVKSGAPAFNFTFNDMNDKPVSLTDFKGKVVYIDVWATWCGPCIQELPHLQKLKEEYKDNPDVVFMAVSVDAQRDHPKWKKFIADNNMTGVQLFAGDKANRELQAPYKITGIPRFMLVGKDGTLVDIDAPRPSSPEIRPVLKRLLN